MKWNPYINGIAAVAYVWGLGLLINHISSLHHDTPDNITGTITAFSLFIFTGAVLAFLFFYRPVMLLIERRPHEALIFFLKTLGLFGITTIIMVFQLV